VVKMASITARVDENVKKEAETLFKKMGLNMSTAMNLFLKKCILEQGIPFELKVPNRETLKAMQETDDILSGKIERKGYNSAEELFEDLGV
jgi:addiction module antitoxin, relB/dinJ family